MLLSSHWPHLDNIDTKRIPCCHSSGQSCPASQVPFPGEPSGEPGNGTWRAGTTLYRVGFFLSPVTIKLLQQKRVLISLHSFYSNLSSVVIVGARAHELLTNHRRDIKTQGEGRWTRQGWIYPMFDVIRHIFTIPLQNQNYQNSG